MSFFEIFWWGAVGSFLGYMAVFVLPQLRLLMEKKERETIVWKYMILIGIVMAVRGGLFAVIMGDASLPKHAAFYGIGWEAGVKGIVSAGRQVIKA